jgi:hypothetical protein
MDRRLQTRLRFARLRHPQACPEDIDYRTPRGLDRTLIATLSAPDWITSARSVIITGPTGVGKSWIACALAHRACRNDFVVIYHRFARLFEELALAHGDSRHARMLKNMAKVKLLILDDFGLAPLTAQARHDLLEILEDRCGRTATLIVSQLPVESWHAIDSIAVPGLGDMPAEALAVPVLGDDEQRDVAVLGRRDHGTVGPPHHVGRVCSDRAVVLGGRTRRAPTRSAYPMRSFENASAAAVPVELVGARSASTGSHIGGLLYISVIYQPRRKLLIVQGNFYFAY